MSDRSTPWPDGTPCWIDYGADDLAAAQAFYAELLGWAFDDGDPQYGGYLTCRLGGRAVAGMMPKMSPEQPTAWQTYFATSDAAATCSRITSAGGSLLAEPMTVGPLGTMVIALDPQAQAFGLWQADAFIGCEAVEEAGTRVWTEAAAPDPAAAREFYTALFGYAHDPVEGAGDYTTFGTDGAPLGGIGAVTPGAPAGWVTCFGVPDTDAAVATVERAGGKVTTAPVDSPHGRYAVLEDPWGAAFSVIQMPST